MEILVRIPEDLEVPLQSEATRVGMTPSMYIQSLVHQCLAAANHHFSQEFANLAGSWEDERSVEEMRGGC